MAFYLITFISITIYLIKTKKKQGVEVVSRSLIEEELQSHDDSEAASLIDSSNLSKKDERLNNINNNSGEE